MKKQIVRLSPHQNGKVFGILMATGSLVFLIPMFVIFKLVAPSVDQHGNQIGFPAFAFLVFPFLYLVLGYVSVVIGCALYNFFFKYIGGFEFESQDQDT